MSIEKPLAWLDLGRLCKRVRGLSMKERANLKGDNLTVWIHFLRRLLAIDQYWLLLYLLIIRHAPALIRRCPFLPT